MGGTLTSLATSFMTEMEVHPSCRCPRSSNGKMAAFFHSGGYRAIIWLALSVFSLLNSNLMSGLLFDVFLCTKRESDLNMVEDENCLLGTLSLVIDLSMVVLMGESLISIDSVSTT